jgi:propanol-preferring alcohol dehydrogenase
MRDARMWTVTRPGPIANRPLALVTRALPRPGPGEVMVRVHACALCRTDLHVVEGELPQRRAHVVPGHQVVGTVTALGDGARDLHVGQRIGVAWLHRTCGQCRFCASARENLCEAAELTGWTVDGGYAEFVLARAAFCYPLPADLPDAQAAPLLCAGIIGYRALRKTHLMEAAAGARLGIYGFGAAGHVVIQLARARGLEVFVMTRDRTRHQALAHELGAQWVGDAAAHPPVPLDAAIVFAPAGELVPAALRALDRGGTLVLGGIHMSPIPSLPYDLLYHERTVCTVANNTRADGHAFLAEAARIAVRTRVTEFAFTELPEALSRLQHDAFAGAAVVRGVP